MDTDEKAVEALRAAADSEGGLVRTVAGFGAPSLRPGRYIHYRTVSALVKRRLLTYVGRGKAAITDDGRKALAHMEAI